MSIPHPWCAAVSGLVPAPTPSAGWGRRVLSACGFTLLELLVVLMLLALVSGVGLMAYEGVREDAAYTVTRSEMAEIRKSLLAFRQDVGHFPDAAGLIASVPDPAGNTPGLRLRLLQYCQNTDTSKTGETHGVSYDAGCAQWNRDTRRGWNGPYLSEPGLLDGWGRPYLLLDAQDATPTDDSDGVARLVSLGPDGVDGAGGILNKDADGCAPITGSDDLVLCLLK